MKQGTVSTKTLLDVRGYIVVHYPNGEMEQLSITFSPDDKEEALEYKNSCFPNRKKDIIAVLK